MAIDSSNNVYVSGETRGALDGNALTGTQNYFLAKYTVDGTKAWTKQMGVSAKTTSANGIAVDSAGYVSIGGTTVAGGPPDLCNLHHGRRVGTFAQYVAPGSWEVDHVRGREMREVELAAVPL